MKQYTQLSQDERYKISRCFKSNISKVQLARELNHSRSTFYREVKHNIGQCGYHPKQVHQLTQSSCYVQTSRLTSFVYEYIHQL